MEEWREYEECEHECEWQLQSASKKIGARGWRGEARDIYKPVKPRQEELAPPVPGSSRSSGFIKGTLAGSVDQVIQILSGNRATRSAILTSGLIVMS